MEGNMSKSIFIVVIILILVSIFPGDMSIKPVNAIPLACADAYCYHLPKIATPFTPQHFPVIARVAPVTETALIIDHRHIDITRIPDSWLAQARNLTIHYGQTSHGSQILDGLSYLETYKDPVKYAFAISPGGTPPTLPAGTDMFKIYTGNNYSGDTYITPDQYWDGTSGIAHTTSTAATGLFDFSMWSWCGQADSSEDYISEYLVQMSAFESAFPEMRFILMTGHNVRNPGTNLQARNQQMRDYAIAHDMVLFDFADIETYDPDGKFYDPTTWNYNDGSCPWCSTWCNADADNQAYCTHLPDCAHTHGLFCKMKAQAFWWMMARLAGWPGY